MAQKFFLFFNRISLAQITADIDAGKGRSVVILEKKYVRQTGASQEKNRTNLDFGLFGAGVGWVGFGVESVDYILHEKILESVVRSSPSIMRSSLAIRGGLSKCSAGPQ